MASKHHLINGGVEKSPPYYLGSKRGDFAERDGKVLIIDCVPSRISKQITRKRGRCPGTGEACRHIQRGGRDYVFCPKERLRLVYQNEGKVPAGRQREAVNSPLGTLEELGKKKSHTRENYGGLFVVSGGGKERRLRGTVIKG